MGRILRAGQDRSADHRGLNTAINDTIKNPDVQQKLATIGFDPIQGSPAQAEAMFKAEVTKWGEMVKALNLSIK